MKIGDLVKHNGKIGIVTALVTKKQAVRDGSCTDDVWVHWNNWTRPLWESYNYLEVLSASR
jgi:hypothetical protein